MSETDQSDIIAFLKRPSTYGLDETVEIHETHISMVFLAGDRAYKLKRAVRLPYADFSTARLRIAACHRELELNRKTATDLYLGVRLIARRGDGSLELDGCGEAVDAVVEMRRFDQSLLFDRMADNGELTTKLIEELSREIIDFHNLARIVHDGTGSANLNAVLDINEAGFATSDVFSEAELEAFNRRFRAKLSKHVALFDRREREGYVRRCHGDMHLRNICLFKGRPTLFDCIDFNEQIATVDVLYDLAFLLMDLSHRGQPHFANLVANRYFDATGNEEAFALLPFLMAVRAAVRAHVTATSARARSDKSMDLEKEARSYFDLAEKLLDAHQPRLLVLGGLSGSGKSTVAEAVAWSLGGGAGARTLESDRIRKSMFGVAPETRLPAEAYRPDVSDRVYRELAERAGRIISSGETAVVNAVYDRADHRAVIEQLARRLQAPFIGIWLSTDAETLKRRVSGREGGASDADIAVLEMQLGRTVQPANWRHVEVNRSLDEVLANVRLLCGSMPSAAA